MSITYGAVVGRFQVDRLTRGHIELLKEASLNHDRLIVFIGILDSPPNAKNPLSYKLREAMIAEEFPDAIILPIHDNESDSEWSRHLDFTTNAITHGFGATFYVGRDSFKNHYSGRYHVVECDFGVESNATERRNQLKNQSINTEQFRAGVIHAHQNLWHRTHLTVDMALVKPVWGGTMMVLIRKPGETQYQLPGGFVNAGELYAEAAEREMQEECHLGAANGWKFVQDVFIDDWRVRNTPYLDHKTHLMFGYTTALADDPIADDDVAEAKWVWTDIIEKKLETMIKRGHLELVKIALKEINRKFK